MSSNPTRTRAPRILLAGTASAFVIMAFGASAAPAKSPLAYRTITAAAPADGDGDATAACPNGTRLTGGGGGISGNEPASELAALEPTDTASDLDTYADDAFHLGAYNAATAGSQVTATAICLRAGADALSYSSGETNLPSSGTYGTGLYCNGERLVGGGAGIVGGTYLGQVRLRTSTPQDLVTDADELFDDGFGFQVLVLNAQGRMLRSSVACLPPGERRLRYVSAQRELAVQETKTLKVDCPARFHVSGGGGGTTGAAVNTQISRPFDGPDGDVRPDDGWLVRGVNPVSTPQTQIVDAICLR